MVPHITIKKILFASTFLMHMVACAQKGNSSITVKEVTHIETTLASDSMQGRKPGTRGNEKAAQFIANQFKRAGLQPLKGTSYLQQFAMVRPKPVHISGTADGIAISPGQLLAVSFQPHLQVTEGSGYNITHINKDENLYQRIRLLMHEKQNQIVVIDSGFAAAFMQLAQLQRPVFEEEVQAHTTSTIFVLGTFNPQHFVFDVQQELERVTFSNVVGVLPGTTKKEEQVIFSAHYDHLGIGPPQAGDSIYNGANDDASGTTAVVLLAKYFKELHSNARTLVFAAFTAEEMGGLGSQYFSQQMNPEKVVAMFNIEMIGTESKWGRNSAYITGFDKTNMGTILQKNLEGSGFTFYPDPYPQQQLFYRSDNATLARLGVPAHTISTSKMDSEPNYHKASDEVKTLDLPNMTEIIKAIAESSKTIVSGADAPTRVQTDRLSNKP